MFNHTNLQLRYVHMAIRLPRAVGQIGMSNFLHYDKTLQENNMSYVYPNRKNYCISLTLMGSTLSIIIGDYSTKHT